MLNIFDNQYNTNFAINNRRAFLPTFLPTLVMSTGKIFSLIYFLKNAGISSLSAPNKKLFTKNASF
jgi:hypothetical protein